VLTCIHTTSRGPFASGLRSLLSLIGTASRAQWSISHLEPLGMQYSRIRLATHHGIRRRTGGRSALRSPCALCTTHSVPHLNFDCMVCCEYYSVGLLLSCSTLHGHGLHSDAATLSAKLVLSCLLCRTPFLRRLSHSCSAFCSLLQMLAHPLLLLNVRLMGPSLSCHAQFVLLRSIYSDKRANVALDTTFVHDCNNG
jgi:hypothetical protein